MKEDASEEIAKKEEEEEAGEGARSFLENEGSFGGPRFCPLLFRQRYSAVISVLRDANIARVADFGCAECQFIVLLRELPGLRNIFGVDIDPTVLKNNAMKIEPRATDFLQPRNEELLIQLFRGSLVDYDARLKDLDALTMIELIEHLDAEPLASFPANVFGRYQPRLVILTTPNAEFNVLFPNFSGFRHWDHKFEWTRKEFEDWCNKICDQYDYTVELSGIGKPPAGSEHLGCCSQMAVFRRRSGDGVAEGTERSSKKAEDSVKTEDSSTQTEDSSTKTEDDEECNYELVAEATFKGKPKLPLEEEILLEAQYCINILLYQELERRGGRWDEPPKDPKHFADACECQLSFGGSCDCDVNTQEDSESVQAASCDPNATQVSEINTADSGDQENPSHCTDAQPGSDDVGNKMPLPLSELLVFPKLASLCEGVEHLRSVLESAEFQISEDGEKVLCDKFPDSDDEAESEEEFDNGYPGDGYPVNEVKEVAEDNWDTDEEECGFVARGEELKKTSKSLYICQECSQIMDRFNLSNNRVPSNSPVLCTYCYGNHCLDCHRLQYSDTLSYEEQYAEWTPHPYVYSVGAIFDRLRKIKSEKWDASAPWSTHKFHLNDKETNSAEEQSLTSLLGSKNEIDKAYLEWGL